MELAGFEPATSSMPRKRAPNCATAPPRFYLDYTIARRQRQQTRARLRRVAQLSIRLFRLYPLTDAPDPASGTDAGSDMAREGVAPSDKLSPRVGAGGGQYRPRHRGILFGSHFSDNRAKGQSQGKRGRVPLSQVA